MNSRAMDFDDLDLENEQPVVEQQSDEQVKLTERVKKLDYDEYFTPKGTIFDIDLDLLLESCALIVKDDANEKNVYELSLKQTSVTFQQSEKLKKIQLFTKGIEFLDHNAPLHKQVLKCLSTQPSEDIYCTVYMIDPAVSNYRGFDMDIKACITLNLEITICLRFIMQVKNFAMDQGKIFQRPPKKGAKKEKAKEVVEKPVEEKTTDYSKTSFMKLVVDLAAPIVKVPLNDTSKEMI